MSTAVMAACWPLQMPYAAKSVLISLADNANDHGECWPSIETIAQRTCLHRATVIRAIETLEKAGHLKADRSNGRRTRYLVTPNLGLFDNQSHRVTGRTEQPVAENDPSQRVANQSHSATQPVAQSDTNRKEPSRTEEQKQKKARASALACPEGVNGQTWEDWLLLRKAKNAPVTETVLRDARREAGKAGMTLDDFLTEWCARGSQGLRADWIKPASALPRGSPLPSPSRTRQAIDNIDRTIAHVTRSRTGLVAHGARGGPEKTPLLEPGGTAGSG